MTNFETLLAEILPKPSDQIITERFSQDAAGCGGGCASPGGCKFSV